MRRDFRERSSAEIEVAQLSRKERSVERQAIRITEHAHLVADGDIEGARALQKKIDAAQRAIDSGNSKRDEAAKNNRLLGVTNDRDVAVWNGLRGYLNENLEKTNGLMGEPEERPKRENKPIPPRVVGSIHMGPRESARVILASPRLDVAIGIADDDQTAEEVIRKYFDIAAGEVGGGDRRRRPVRHCVLVPPENEPPERSIDRVKVALAFSGVDLHTGCWVALEHDGTGSKGPQGRHIHLVWVAPADRKSQGGHLPMAAAARAWAWLNDNEGAAQSVSRGVNSAAHRDWEHLDSPRLWAERPTIQLAGEVVAWHDRANAGGLWLAKPGWRADQMPDSPKSISTGRERFGSWSHLLGHD